MAAALRPVAALGRRIGELLRRATPTEAPPLQI